MAPADAPMASPIVLRRGERAAIPLATDRRLTVVNVDGGQVVDFWAIVADRPDEHLSMEHTRVALAKLVPQAGDKLVSSSRRPILELSQDTSPGIHDTLMAACDPQRYRLLGATLPHANCAENFDHALTTRGLRSPALPSPLNLFMSVVWDTDGTLEFRPSPARARDQVTFTALIDVVVVVSICPMDVNPINRDAPPDARIELTTR